MNNFFVTFSLKNCQYGWFRKHTLYSVVEGSDYQKLIGKSEAIICFSAKLFDQRDKFDKNLRFEAMNQ
jgi:hypothetical protein